MVGRKARGLGPLCIANQIPCKMKITLNYQFKTLSMSPVDLKHLTDTYPTYSCIDFSYTTEGRFFIVLSKKGDAIENYITAQQKLLIVSHELFTAINTYVKSQRPKAFDVDALPYTGTEDRIYLQLSPCDIETKVSSQVAKERISSYSFYDFPGRIKTNETKLAEQVLDLPNRA